ncbi:MAG: hypothetical protein ACFFDH_11445 [Promethearchaeota archaeon]
MGITSNTLDFEDEVIEKAGFEWNKIRMCELGSQLMVNGKISSKAYYILKKNVIEHVSLDLNGLYGSLIVDLCLPVHESFFNRFHLITNYGTTEHVNNQYQVFKNIHDMCKVKGVMIHVLPIPDNWPNHCRYYYPRNFFDELAKLCNYEIIKIVLKNAFKPPKPKKMLVFVAFYKQTNEEFISKMTFKTLNIVDTKVLRRVGNYSLQKDYQIYILRLIRIFKAHILGKILFERLFKQLYRKYYDLRH